MIRPLFTDCRERIGRVVSSVLSKTFYAGYDPLDPKVAGARRQGLIDKFQAVSLECRNSQGVAVDVLYIPSTHPHRTGNGIVFAETTSYQDRLDHGLPLKYQHFLDGGADLVLWNPTKLQSRQYAQDLLSVLQVLRKRDPQQKIVVKGHCATVEPALDAAEKLAQGKGEPIALILDRGFADTYAFARSFTILAQLPLVHSTILQQFSCSGRDKLVTFPGKIIFIAPEDPTADQVTYWAGKNLTYEMQEYRGLQSSVKDLFVKLSEGSDHWSSWNTEEYRQIDTELHHMGILAPNFPPFSAEPSSQRFSQTFCGRLCFSIFNKAWC